MKIFRKASLVALIILLTIVNYTWAHMDIPKNEDALIEAFKATEADPLQVNISSNAVISNDFIKIDKLMDIAKEIIEELEIVERINQDVKNHNINNNIYDIEVIEDSDMNQIIVWGKDSEERIITLILVSEKHPYSDFKQTTVFVDVIQNRTIDNINDIKSKIKKVFNNLNTENTETEISTCIIGTFKGQLKSKDKIAKISQAVGKVQGNKVEGLFEPSIISVSIYTPNIDRYIYTGNNKMNLNISMRYNEYEDKTYIWMGTPIITIGY